MDPLEETIRRRAHEIWEREGRPLDYAHLHWERAKQELSGQGIVPSKASTTRRIVAGVMNPAISAAPEDRLDVLVQRMKASNVGFLPVCDEERVVGVVTDRDILMRCVASGGSLSATTAAQAMTAAVRCCLAEDSIEEALAAMRQSRVRRLPVLDENRRLLGVVSYSDLTREQSGHAPYHISFYKELTDNYGQPHHVEVARVRIGPGHLKAEAVAAAVRELEREKQQPWRRIADGYTVRELRAERMQDVATAVGGTES